jgi:hypothetical protein
MHDIWVSLHSIRLRPTDFRLYRRPTPGHYNFSYDIINNFFMRLTFQDFAGYPRILGIVDLRPLRGRHAYKAS